MLQRRSFLKTATGTTVAVIAGLTQATSQVFANEANSSQRKPNGDATCDSIKMETRHLGGTLEVSAIGLGFAPTVGQNGSASDKNKMIALLRKAYDNGVTFFDISESYGSNISEELVGEALRPVRQKVKIATKFGFTGGQGFSAESRSGHIRQAVEASLRRMGTDYIDLLYQHQGDSAIPVEEVASTVKDLIKEGKVLNWGLTEASAQTIRKAQAVCPLATVQSEYSIWYREPERKIFPTLEAYGIGFVPYGSLGYGFLSGAISEKTTFAQDDYRYYLKQFSPEAIKHNMPLAQLIKAWAARKDMTPAQFALAWMLSRKPWIVPIPGTTNSGHLTDLLGAGIPRLAAWEMDEFDREYAKIDLIGQREDQLYAI